jgi:hypothetical protein
MRPKFALLKEAYAIIDGIPAKRFDLADIVNGYETPPSPHNCNTIGCAIGWLAMHPKFQKLGLGLDARGGLMWKGHPAHFDDAAAELFSIPRGDADVMFEARWDPTTSRQSSQSDKTVWKQRVRNFLRAHDQL